MESTAGAARMTLATSGGKWMWRWSWLGARRRDDMDGSTNAGRKSGTAPTDDEADGVGDGPLADRGDRDAAPLPAPCPPRRLRGLPRRPPRAEPPCLRARRVLRLEPLRMRVRDAAFVLVPRAAARAGGASANRGGRGGPDEGVGGPVKLTTGVGCWRATGGWSWLTKTTAECGVDAYLGAPPRELVGNAVDAYGVAAGSPGFVAGGGGGFSGGGGGGGTISIAVDAAVTPPALAVGPPSSPGRGLTEPTDSADHPASSRRPAAAAATVAAMAASAPRSGLNCTLSLRGDVALGCIA